MARRAVVHDAGEEPEIQGRQGPHHLLGLEAERLPDRLGPVRRELVLDLEVAHLPLEPALERGRELVPVDVHLVDGGQPDHAQLVELGRAAGQEQVGAQAQQLAEPDVGILAAGDLDQSRDAVRHAQQVLEHAVAAGEVQGPAPDLAQRLDAQHVGARRHLLRQERAEVGALGAGERARRDDADAQVLELGEERPVGRLCPLQLGARLLEERPVLLRPAPLHERAPDARREELVHVRGPDGEEPEALERGKVGPARLVEDPAVELEPGELLWRLHGSS